jgi:hypothetical protein
MPAYDEALAQQVLLALQEVFPNKVSSHELKARPSFIEVPEDLWLLALDALLKLGFIDGTPYRRGFKKILDGVANLEITLRGRQSLSDTMIRAEQMGINHGASNKNSKILVTVGGECFEAEFIEVGHSGGRDGVLYLFKLRDLVKDRGQRNVALFRSGTERVFIEDYDARVETVRLNVLRRAFDSGAFGFDKLVEDPDRYHELRLRAADFQSQKKADDETIRRFIKFGAYFLGFKFSPSGPNPFLDFDDTEDLEYLGATKDDIGRNVWFLTQKGYLNSSSAATFDHPSTCSPTSKLIDEIEHGDVESPRPIGATVTQNFHLYGPNSRINTNSTDNSVNVASVLSEKTFVHMREAAQSISDESERAKILSRLDDLESTRGSSGFLSAYQTFIATVADHMTVFAPFIPALAQMLTPR